MGSNIKINDNLGLDFGLQYNIIPSLEAIESSYAFEDDDDSDELDSMNVTVTQIAKTINADYITFYIGCYFKL